MVHRARTLQVPTIFFRNEFLVARIRVGEFFALLILLHDGAEIFR